jgi:DMSO/TMAO reductase YedYZ heme-binding membrane subunit
MPIDYGQGSFQQPPAAYWLTTVPQRLSVIALLLAVAVIGRSAVNPEPSYLSFAAVFAAYATVAGTLIGVVLAYRREQSLRELLALLTFSLLVAHVSTWAMMDPRGPLISSIKLYTTIHDGFVAIFLS